MKIGALEAGGTKMVCAAGDENGRITAECQFPTETPETTLPRILAFFQEQGIESLGIACFGPIDLHKDSPTYGAITSTPKLAWQDCRIVPYFQEALRIPVGFDTDVNASMLGELFFGAAQGLTDCLYLTVGTGIGAGILSGGQLVHGLLHPEAGHVFVQKRPEDLYTGHCPYHPSCLEGLASGPAMEDRWGKPASELPPDHPAWIWEADYLGQALTGYLFTISPQRMILGGGVMNQSQLFPLIRRRVKELLGGYLRARELEDLDTFIVPPACGGRQGILGCLRLGYGAKQEG